jgi:hypothetical protein
MAEETVFRTWARAVVDNTAARLIEVIDDARAGSPSSLTAGYEAVYVHFSDAAVPQRLCVWIYSTLARGDNNFAGYGDIIGVGLKHDADEELDPGAWRFRLQGSRFRWRKHCDARYEGFRLIESADALRAQPVEEAAKRVCATVLHQLERSNALQRRGGGTS